MLGLYEGSFSSTGSTSCCDRWTVELISKGKTQSDERNNKKNNKMFNIAITKKYPPTLHHDSHKMKGGDVTSTTDGVTLLVRLLHTLQFTFFKVAATHNFHILMIICRTISLTLE